MVTRREFLQGLAAWGAAAAASARGLGAQEQAAPAHATSQGAGMTQGHIPVRRPPKPGVAAVVDEEARNGLERRLSCQCPCTLDVYTCRTTDFSCQVSPAMHRDVLALVEGGYDAQEIIDAFTATYGERVLMAPTRSGFNWVGWLTPFAALGAGAAAVAVLIGRWRDRAAAAEPARALAVQPTPEELARLQAAVSGDDR